MRPPRGPFLEIAFYFASTPEVVVMKSLVQSLLSLGAAFAGTGNVHQGKGIRDTPFTAPYDLEQQQVQLHDEDQFNQILSDLDQRLTTVHLTGATGLYKNIAEIVTFERISEEACLSDHHPIVIWTDGDRYSDQCEQVTVTKKRSKSRPNKLEDRFIELCRRTRPLYAAITIEESLRCPTDLSVEWPPCQFSDFFLDDQVINSGVGDDILLAAANAYTRRIENGIYISTTSFANSLACECPLDEVDEVSKNTVNTLLTWRAANRKN